MPMENQCGLTTSKNKQLTYKTRLYLSTFKGSPNKMLSLTISPRTSTLGLYDLPNTHALEPGSLVISCGLERLFAQLT